MLYPLAFLFSMALAVIFTRLVLVSARRLKVLDYPSAAKNRKIHSTPTPLLGGLAVITAFDIATLVLYFSLPLLRDNIPLSNMAAVWLASLVLGLGGVLDDAKNLKPSVQFLFPLLAVLIVVGSGVGVPHITNPFGGRFILAGPEIFGLGLASVLFV